MRNKLFATCLCTLASVLYGGLATANPGVAADGSGVASPTAPTPGHIWVRDPQQGVVEFPLKMLEPHGYYRVTVKLYRAADDPAVTFPFMPLPEGAQKVGQSALTMVDGVAANFQSAKKGEAVRPLAEGEQPPWPAVAGERELTAKYDMLCFLYAPGADQSQRSPYGPQDGAQRQLLAAADHLAVGGFDLYVYAPAANRAEVFIERAEIAPELRFADGGSIPDLVMPAEPAFAPYAWLAAQLRATEQGWLFMDGMSAPEPVDAEPTAPTPPADDGPVETPSGFGAVTHA